MESVFIELDQLDLNDEQRHQLGSLIDANLHHTILDAILTELNPEDKKVFLEYLSKDDHDKIWEHLNSKVDNIEEKIKNAAEQLKKELDEDIKESKKVK